MTERIQRLLDLYQRREYRRERVHIPDMELCYQIDGLKNAELLRDLIEMETPVLRPDDRIGFHRSTDAPTTRDSGGNVTPNYGRILSGGLEPALAELEARMTRAATPEQLRFGKGMRMGIESAYRIADRYRDYAKEQGCHELYRALGKVPRQGAESFYEACVMMKLLIYTLRLGGVGHLTLGRFDQYMYPYFRADLERGVSQDALFELLEEFFININFDTDLYVGVQQGDNGQSMVLGGFDRDGKSMYNELSQLCMLASRELKLIDPKINLRVGKNTPEELFVFGTTLTKEGLGFPQYCNDDVVVPGLVKLGYDYQDALDYTVAACWEYIIPGCGGDVPNYEVMDFPLVVNQAIVENLQSCDTFPALMDRVREAIAAECDRLVERCKDAIRYSDSCPLLSVCMDGCIESLRSLFDNGAKYSNFGSHGAGIANAADALAAVQKTVYQDKSVTKATLLAALAHNFEGDAELRNLLCDCPKMGNNDDAVDDIACALMEAFSKNLNGRDNGHGGIWRAGTGSAMEYLWRGEKCPATADGRRAGESYSSSFSPALNAKTNGLLSVIQSFTKYDLTDIINGGPLTIEVHDTTLRNEEGIRKTAKLVREFILLGGHQLQINSVNRERLLDAQKHPENYPDLIVRVWGWSGYFNELDVKYQNHIIQRTEYTG